MIKISNSIVIHISLKLLVFLAIAKIMGLAMLWYFPNDGIELIVKTNKQPKYQRVDFKNMISDAPISTVSTKVADKSNNSISITNMILKGFYGKSSKGFAILALKSTPNKTSIIEVGELFSSYKLKAINPLSVVFIKAGIEYTLELENKNKNKKSTITKVKKRAVYTPGDKIEISRKDIKRYSDNPKELWKDISLHDEKKGNKLIGFKITRIKKESKLATLGLRAQDIIVKVNNVELTSYKEVFDIYKKLKELTTIQIVVMRQNKEKEFVYEIN